MTDHVPAPVVNDNLREQMAKALLGDALARVNDPDPETVEEIQDDYRKTADALLPVITAHVAAERERAVRAVRAVLNAPTVIWTEDEVFTVVDVDDLRAALPAQPADQAQETHR